MRETLLEVRQHLPVVKRKPWWIIFGVFLFVLGVLAVYSIASRTKAQCVDNDECEVDRVCVRNTCMDPCVGLCGPNTTCHVVDHIAVCACRPDHSGHPIIGCSPPPLPTVPLQPVQPQPTDHGLSTTPTPVPTCTLHRHCPDDEVCVNNMCAPQMCTDHDSCPGLEICIAFKCVDDEDERSKETTPAKTCEVHLDCSENELCISNKCTVPLCENHNHCRDDEICVGFKCVDREHPITPTPVQMCEAHHDCIGKKHCISNICVDVEESELVVLCRDIEDKCTGSEALVSGECRDPCKNLCGINTDCHVSNHIPACACKEGYQGNPFVECIPIIQGPLQNCASTPTRKKKYYFRDDISVSWYAAEEHCKSNNSQLASVESMEELDKINDFFQNSGVDYGRFWTAGTDADQEGYFVWSTSNRYIPLKTGLWWDGEPNSHLGGDEDCVDLWSKSPIRRYKMNDAPCSTELHFICEYYEN